jgi:hypothetical protein
MESVEQREYSDRVYETYSKKCAEQLLNLFNLVKTILQINNYESARLEENINAISSGSTELLSISDLFSKFLKPYYEFLKKTLLPKDKFIDNNQIPPKEAFVLMQISIVLIVQHLSNIEKASCITSQEYRKKLENFYKELDLNDLNKSILIINKNIRLNITFQLNTADVPSQVLEAYSAYFKKILQNPGLINGLEYLNSIIQKIKNIVNSTNYTLLRLETSIPWMNDIPNDVLDLVPFVDLNSENDVLKAILKNNVEKECEKELSRMGSSSKKRRYSSSREENLQLKKGGFTEDGLKLKETLRSNYMMRCSKNDNSSKELKNIESETKRLKMAEGEVLTHLDRNCFANVNVILDNITNKTLSKLMNENNDINSKGDDSIQSMFEKLLTNLKSINIISQDYVTQKYQTLDEDIIRILNGINPEIGDSTNYSIENFQRMAQFSQVLNRLDYFMQSVEKTINTNLLLRKNVYRIQSIEKSIMKYAPEVVLKNEYCLLTFFKCSWLNFFFKYSSNDMFSWLKKFDSQFNKKYLLVIGSINARVAAQFVYSVESSPFFNNQKLQSNIKKEYFDSLEPSLGNLLRMVLFKMIEIKGRLRNEEFFSSLDLTTNNSYNISKKLLNEDYELCFSTVNNTNRGLNIVLLSCDYMILSLFIRCLVDKNQKIESTLKNFFKFLFEENSSNLTNVVYLRWIIWATILLGDVKGSTWKDCCIEINKNMLETLFFNSFQKHFEFFKSNTTKISNLLTINKNDSEINLTLFPVKQAYKTKINTTKLNAYVQNPEKFPNINDFTIESNIDGKKGAEPSFYNSDCENKDNQLVTKFILLNKIGNVFGSTLLYMFDETNFIFFLVDVVKQNLTIKFV